MQFPDNRGRVSSDRQSGEHAGDDFKPASPTRHHHIASPRHGACTPRIGQHMQDATRDFDFDVVIVGASFAGAACAIAAAQRGLRVCVLERKRDPGEKLRTTGIVVKEAAERTLLHRLPAGMTRRIEAVRLYAPSLKQVALAAPGYYFLSTDTPAVMRWLAEQLRAHGVDLRLGCAFTDAARIADGWQVQGAGSTRYLVGADGARSRVARRY
jgi:flavin-dependent dehydrogenase